MLALGHMAFVGTLVLCFLSMLPGSFAAQYEVGGPSQWNLNVDPTFYQKWADAINFVAGDTLLFKYPPGAHDVATVTLAEFNACSTIKAPRTSGNDVVPLTAGTQYFFCTQIGHCSGGGMKFSVTVGAASAGTPPPARVATPPPQISSPPPAQVAAPPPNTTATTPPPTQIVVPPPTPSAAPPRKQVISPPAPAPKAMAPPPTMAPANASSMAPTTPSSAATPPPEGALAPQGDITPTGPPAAETPGPSPPPPPAGGFAPRGHHASYLVLGSATLGGFLLSWTLL